MPYLFANFRKSARIQTFSMSGGGSPREATFLDEGLGFWCKILQSSRFLALFLFQKVPFLDFYWRTSI